MAPFDIDMSMVESKHESNIEHDNDIQNELEQMTVMQPIVQEAPTAGGWGMPPPLADE
jgi:hypothetical protein